MPVVSRTLGVPSQLVHQRWTKDEGLPQNSVTAALQSRQGPVWLGTQEGLVRFDGVRFHTYRTERYPGLVSNDITSLYEGAKGTLWIGTQGGISRFDGSSFKTLSPHGLPHPAIRALAEDGQGNLWIGTLGGLARYDGHTLSSAKAADLPDTRVVSLSRDARGRMWIGTLGGLVLFDGSRFRQVPLPAPLGRSEVRALHLDARQQLWVGTSAGLARLLTTGTFETFAHEPGAAACSAVQALTTDTHGVLWVGTQGNGVCARGEGRFYTYDDEPGLATVRVTALAPDLEGGVLIGLASAGLRRLHRGPFLTVGERQGMPTGVVLSVLEGRDGAVWMGTDGGGLVQHRTDGQLVTLGASHGLPSATIMALAERHDGTLWVGAAGGGACQLIGGNFRCLSRRDGLLSDNIFSMLETREGRFWIGTEAGLNRLVGGRIEDLSKMHPALSGHYIMGLHEATNGDVWAATYGAGVVRIRGDEAISFGSTEGLKSLDALTLLSDAQGGIWAGFDGGGLCRFDERRERFRCYGSRDGLFDDRVLQLIEDEHGYFWLGSNRGYVRVRRADIDAFDAGRLPRIPYQEIGMTKHDGLRDAEANGGLQPSAVRTRAGTLLFATVGGLAVMDPAHLSLTRRLLAPPAYLDYLEVEGQSFNFPLPTQLRLKAHQRDLRLRVGVVTLSVPDRAQIRYRLMGYRDSAWRTQRGLDRDIVFTNLPPGAYQLEVEAGDGAGGWNRVATLGLEIAPYYYETWWFYLVVALSASLVIALLFRLRVRALKRRQAELETIVEHRTAELRAREHEKDLLNAQLEQVNVGLEAEVHRQVEERMEERRLYEMELVDARDKAEESARLKQAILSNMSHEIRTPIAGILGFSEILEVEAPEELQEFVTHITTSGRRLLGTLDAVLELSQLESGSMEMQPELVNVSEIVGQAVESAAVAAQRKGVAVTHEIPAELHAVVDTYALNRIAHHVLSNAVKFTDHGEVRVCLAGTAHDFEIRISDTGHGMSEAFMSHLFEPFKQESDGLARSYEGAGIGLALTQRFVTALGGTIEVQSQLGAGTTVSIRLPHAAHSGDGAARVVASASIGDLTPA